MEDSTADGKATGNPTKIVHVNGTIIAVDEIAFAYNGTSTEGDPVDGCQIEFKRKGTLFIPGLTTEGLFSLIDGAPF